ncbi:ABC-2 family transporter protein [Dactylosporangium sp. NPDC050588]|uniref:ABC transporter permease n=1 Tax=Dactylosporangium sp. NPDC050588 TaxID=3157211 RepID=UPI0033FD358D
MANPYVVLVRMRMRAQTVYRGSFAVEILASLGATVSGFGELYVIFANVPALGGLDFTAAVLVFAIGHVSFSLADLVVGHLDALPTYLRAGTLDAFLLRPLPVLAQLITADISLRRFGRTVAGTAIAVTALASSDVDWTPAKGALLAVTVCSGAALFAAFFVGAAAVQFWLVEGTEFTASFVYGGNYAAQFPASVFATPVRVLFTFVVPAAFVAYLPVLTLLDLPGGGALGWCSPVAAAAVWIVALLGWRAGLRHYTGAGS